MGLALPPPPNAAMAWGTSHEAAALSAYEALTHQHVTRHGFAVWGDDGVNDWLGASPDGLVTPSGPQDPYAGPGEGMLEIKCPFNRGMPDSMDPWAVAPYYYMPQVQGQMAILGRQWCNLYVWTPRRGSALFHVHYDDQYWRAMWEVLAVLWWRHVEPARADVSRAGRDAAWRHRPSALHELYEHIKAESERMARAAQAVHFLPLPGLHGGPVNPKP